MKILSKIEKHILLHLMKQNKRMTCGHIIIHDEKLRTQFSKEELIESCETLKKEGIIEFGGSNGHISTPTALKAIKKRFRFKLMLHKIEFSIKKLWKFLWKHFFITMMTSALTTLITLLVTGYFHPTS